MRSAATDIAPVGSSSTRRTSCIRSPIRSRSASAARASSRARKASISTTREGRKLLDGMSGLWCVAVGYGRKELAEAAARQMNELPYYNSFFQCATPPAIELAAKLAELTPPQFQHVFFTGSGSESIDTIIRMVRRYWQLEGQPERNVIIGRWNGYHGSTIAGASLGGMKWMHEQGLLPMPGVAHINQPYWFERGWRSVPGGVRACRGRASWKQDPATRPGARRRLHRRTDPGRGRRHHPARHLLARDPAHLRPLRHPAGLRRGDLWLRPHRRMVRLRVLRHAPGPHDHGQGALVRLSAHRRRDGGRPGREDADRARAASSRTASPTRRIRSAAAVALANLEIIAAREAGGACPRHRGAIPAAALGRVWPSIRWSARRAASACSARWSWCKASSPRACVRAARQGRRALP